MRLNTQYDKGVNLLAVSSAENCDTDSWPMVPEIQFRNYRGNLNPELGAVAAAILFARHCGTVADFNGAKISIDTARAIRRIMLRGSRLSKRRKSALCSGVDPLSATSTSKSSLIWPAKLRIASASMRSRPVRAFDAIATVTSERGRLIGCGTSDRLKRLL